MLYGVDGWSWTVRIVREIIHCGKWAELTRLAGVNACVCFRFTSLRTEQAGNKMININKWVAEFLLVAWSALPYVRLCVYIFFVVVGYAEVHTNLWSCPFFRHMILLSNDTLHPLHYVIEQSINNYWLIC